jgi:hypothetical protein
MQIKFRLHYRQVFLYCKLVNILLSLSKPPFHFADVSWL